MATESVKGEARAIEVSVSGETELLIPGRVKFHERGVTYEVYRTDIELTTSTSKEFTQSRKEFLLTLDENITTGTYTLDAANSPLHGIMYTEYAEFSGLARPYRYRANSGSVNIVVDEPGHYFGTFRFTAPPDSGSSPALSGDGRFDIYVFIK